jgi:hypothetical protein
VIKLHYSFNKSGSGQDGFADGKEHREAEQSCGQSVHVSAAHRRLMR